MICKYEDKCLNSALCSICEEQKLLKLPHKRKPKRSGKARAGTAFERKVRKRIIERQTRPTVNSGAFWFSKGDLSLTHKLRNILMEIKERGTLTTKGEKTISIQKAWLDKIIIEAMHNGDFPCLPFGYKGDDRIYVVMVFDDLLQILQALDEYIGGRED